MRANAKHSRKGMTLIEAMVAITILAVITTIVYGGFAQTMRNKTRVEAQSDRAHVIRVAMERMVRELSMAFVSVHVNPNPSLRGSLTAFHGYREGRASRIDFTSFSHRRLYRDSHESDQNELSYFVARHPEHRDQRVLARREQRRIDTEPDRGGEVTILVEDVREFQLEYLDGLTLDWVDSWDAAPDGTQANRLPIQVRVRLVVPGLNNPRNEETYTTRAVIPITWAINHAVYNP
jgi:general secretion pathway protein J